jgi:predicted alpha/beta-hydrolase family hydrolase
MPHALYLGGDSYPDDAHCEEQVISELTSRLRLTFTRQSELMPNDTEAQKEWRASESRFQQLEQAIARLPKNETIILIGRSSGSRIATQFAHAESTSSNSTNTAPTFSNIAAVIGLAYPFRAPGQKIEPTRFEHLADISTPTLIIQGNRDEYGGAEAADNYELSPSVELLSVEADHGVNLSAEDWEKTFKQIVIFLIRAAQQHKAKRDEHRARLDSKVFNRSVYYFGGTGSQDAKRHYEAYLALTHKHNQHHKNNQQNIDVDSTSTQKISNSVTITPLQWDTNQTFWKITNQTVEDDTHALITHTNYHFLEWPQSTRSTVTARLAKLWRAVKQLKNICMTTVKTVFVRQEQKPTQFNPAPNVKQAIARILTDQEPTLSANIAHQAAQLIAGVQTGINEEILIVGQGLGSVLATQCVLQAYEQYPTLFEQKTKINLLTVNLQSILANRRLKAKQVTQSDTTLTHARGLSHVDLNLPLGTDLTLFTVNSNEDALANDSSYNYLDITTGLIPFKQIFSVQTLPELPEDFDPIAYLQLNQDVAQKNQDPVLHWQQHGAKEKRLYHLNLPLGFAAQQYLAINPDVAVAGLDPVQHYLMHGEKEKRSFI